MGQYFLKKSLLNFGCHLHVLVGIIFVLNARNILLPKPIHQTDDNKLFLTEYTQTADTNTLITTDVYKIKGFFKMSLRAGVKVNKVKGLFKIV